MTTLSQSLAAFAVSADPPDEVRSSVRSRVRDTLGVAVGASRVSTSVAIASYAMDLGGAPQSRAIGIDGRIPAANAALVNGTLAHSLDFDDTHLPSILHPSAPCIPACLATADLVGASSDDLVRAIAVALEICVRLGMAGYDDEARTSIFFERGQHATASCGAIAGAAASALLLGLGEEGIVDAIGVAASMASGIFEANRTGGTVKRLHCGWAAHAAVTAADLVRRGFTGPPTALDGRFGFFEAQLAGRYDASAITDGLGEDWSVPDILFKPYPANHFTHTTIDAMLALRSEGLRPDDVDSVTVGIAGPTVRSVGEPIDVKRAPTTGYAAQFSIPFVVAAALYSDGLVGLDDFTDELAQDPARRALAARVSVEADDECTKIYPYHFPAIVGVRTKSGEELVRRQMANRDMNDDELRSKFDDCVRNATGAASQYADNLIAFVES